MEEKSWDASIGKSMTETEMKVGAFRAARRHQDQWYHRYHLHLHLHLRLCRFAERWLTLILNEEAVDVI
jgi:hypothetical protein